MSLSPLSTLLLPAGLLMMPPLTLLVPSKKPASPLPHRKKTPHGL